jgi:ABC-2 type transport system permease protein
MSAFASHFAFQFRTGIRNRSMLLLNYLFPLAFYLLMGMLMTQINPFFLETMIPGMVVFAILSATFLGMPDPLVTAREAGIFRSYKISGVPASHILAVPALSALVHTIIVSAVVTVTAAVFFDAPLPTMWPGFVLTFLVTAFACAGLAVLIGVVSPSSQMTVLWSQLVFIPSMILSGLSGVPQDVMPASIGKIAQILPPTHAVNGFRGLAYGVTTVPSATASIIALTVGGALAFGLAIYLFNWDRRSSTPRGHPLLALLALLPYVAALFLPS